MSSKMNYIPHISSYEDIRAEMSNDLQYRLASRTAKTSLGRPLYYRINVQMITTQECPFHCPFCLERQNPMSGDNDFDAQIEALKRVCRSIPTHGCLSRAANPVFTRSTSPISLRLIVSTVMACFVPSTLRDLARS